MVKICIIALVGLPASGKTTFCKTILKSSIEFNWIHLCYDELFTYMPQSSKLTFKEERRKVLRKIEQIIDSIKFNKYLTEGVTFWKQSSSEVFVIICDDNNYYAGMRYEIYKICKEHHLSFGQIYFPLDLGEALSRNSDRGAAALPRSVIEQINIRLEEPSNKNQWEKNTFTIARSFDHEQLQSFLKICLDNPLQSICKEEGLTNKKPNVIHEIDLLLRKRIKESLQKADGDVRDRAKILNERRKNILLEVKKTEGSGEDLNVDCILERLFCD